MTVKELICLNQRIVDLVIEVRNYPDDGKLLEALYIGPSAGVEPPYPTMIGPYNNASKQRKAIYTRKNINTWDDGKDYWHTKVDSIPKQFLNLEVWSWNKSEAYKFMQYHSRDDNSCSAECYIVTTFKPQYDGLLEYQEEKPATNEQKQIEGQMSIEDFLGGNRSE